MDNLLKRAQSPAKKKDARITLILIIAAAFLLFSITRIIERNRTHKSVTESYSLTIDNISIPVNVKDKTAEEHISPIPWNLTPFFFKKLPINSADREALMTIRGIGPKLAESILKRRQEYGPFKKVDDLQNVSGVGPKRLLYFEKMFDFGGEK